MSFVFHRRLYRRKPKQWGNLSAVRSAVMRNAESVFGIDPSYFVFLLPFWEGGGGTVNSVIGPNFDMSANWGNGGGLFNTPTGRCYGASPIPQDVGSYFVVHKRLDAKDLYSLLLNIETLSNNSPHEMFFGSFSDNYLSFWPNKDQSSEDYWRFGNYETTLPLNEEVVLSTHWDNGSVLKGYRNGQLYGSLTGGATWTDSAWGSEVSGIGNAPDSANSYASCGGIINVAMGFSGLLNENQTLKLHDLPYQLVTPNPAPLYFDMGAAPSQSPVPLIMQNLNQFNGGIAALCDQ